MKGELVLINDLTYDDKKCDFIPSAYDFGLSLYVDDENNLERQLNNKRFLTESINEIIEFFKKDNSMEVFDIKIYQNLRDNIDNLFDYVEYVSISIDNIDILKFISDNPILKSKKIVLPIVVGVNDYEKILELLEKYNEYKDKIYVSMNCNMGYVSLFDCLDTISIIKKEAENILKLNLSPMETIMYTYDQVRNRVYAEEDDCDLTIESRDLNSVLKGEKIVCVGYSNIFMSLLYYMGYQSYKVNMNDKNDEYDGHVRNVMYIKDDKYDIDGVYYFDTTWDSKKTGETNEFLNRYLFFAKTLKEMQKLEKNNFIYEQCPSYADNMLNKLQNILEISDICQIDINDIFSINYMTRLIYGDNLIEFESIINPTTVISDLEKKKLLEKFHNVEEKFDRPISAETFISLLNNVRKIEYYQNPEFYPYTIDNIYETYVKSKWQFSKHYYTDEQRLLFLIFGKNEITDRNDRREDFINFAKGESFNRNIKEVQITKVLQKVYQKRINKMN